MTSKMKVTLKMKTTSKMKMKITSKKNCTHPLKRILPEIFMTSHLDSFGTTDIKPEMLSGVQTGNGTAHDIYDIRGIAHAHTNRKNNIFMERRLVKNFTYILVWGQGTL